MFVDRLVSFIVDYLRPFIKFFLHTFTRLTELQRICYGARGGAPRSLGVERSLQLSKNKAIQTLLREFDERVTYCSAEDLLQFHFHSVNVVCKAKNIKPRCHPDFGTLFGASVVQIWSYRRLVHAVERLRAQSYDAEDIEQEQKLLNLWNLLMPEHPLVGRISRQWQEIGFQGDDPKTDFRGMGLLGLENLLYFAREYTVAAQHVLLHSRHPTYGYTFAIVGINLTAMSYRLLKSGGAKTHFYNLAHSIKQPCTIAHFHNFYCYLLFEFDRFWMQSKPKDIMDFREIYQSFEIQILEILSKKDTIFKTNLIVEDV